MTEDQEKQSPPRPGEGAADGNGSDASGSDASGSAAPAAHEGERAGDELEALRERHLRLAAEYDNYRRRTERERGESWARAQAQLVERLLDALDDLQRVADYTADTTTTEALLEGMQMVERKLLRVLEDAGLEVLAPEGQRFDPAVHEALMTTPAGEDEEGETVGQVLQKGYRFKGQLLRPARVQVKTHG